MKKSEIERLKEKYKLSGTRKPMKKSKTVWASLATAIGGVVLIATGVNVAVGAQMIGTGTIGMFLRHGVEALKDG